LSVKDKQTVNLPVWIGLEAVVIGGALLVFGNKRGSAHRCYRISENPIRKDVAMETGPKILVVDDNSVLRILISKMLSRIGYDVASADSGEKGLGLFLKNAFDIVLSDFEMPGMDGVALACSIKKCSPHTPVVIMTGAGRAAVLSKSGTGVDQVISKPFSLAEIDATMRGLSKTLRRV
jgi:CheY-like chemotaxis protein